MDEPYEYLFSFIKSCYCNYKNDKTTYIIDNTLEYGFDKKIELRHSYNKDGSKEKIKKIIHCSNCKNLFYSNI
jgi:hypothetical protein